jgi:hypothetical protein
MRQQLVFRMPAKPQDGIIVALLSLLIILLAELSDFCDIFHLRDWFKSA